MPGPLVVGLYGSLLTCVYGYFWITTMLLIAGGYMFSLNHPWFLIFMATAYALFVNTHVGLHGIFLSLNLSYSKDMMMLRKTYVMKSKKNLNM